jgi:hypothetical protein
MKVLFTDKHKYVGMSRGKYIFEDNFGDTFMTKQAKLVDRDNNIVKLFLDDNGSEKIQYSHATARRLGFKLNLKQSKPSNIE